jgi:hypothetical protein
VLALVALAAPVPATGDEASKLKTPRTVLAIEPGPGGNYLVRLDAKSLKRVSKSVWIGGSACAAALSPGGRRLALAMCGDYAIQIFDARRLNALGDIRSADRYTSVLAWPSPRRLVWLGTDRIFAADPVTRKRRPTATLEGSLIMTAQRLGKTLVLLAAPTGDIGPARLVVVGTDGRVRSVTLADIRAGTTFNPESMKGEERRPGLAVAPDGRAFVVGAGDDPVAEVDLGTLVASYHRPERRRSLLTRFRDWLEPRAEGKMELPGSSRHALWLSEGRLAIWGRESVRTGPDRVATTPIGLSVVDTHNWNMEPVDDGAEDVGFAAGVLLATAEGAGLTAYSTDGRRLYRAFEGESVFIAATFGPRVFLFPLRGRIRVVDAATGRLLGTRRNLPWILHDGYAR